MSQRANSSLLELSHSFIDAVCEHPRKSVDINRIADKLNVTRLRRIYDVTCPLEGLSLLKKGNKTSASWAAPRLSLIHAEMRRLGLLVPAGSPRRTSPKNQHKAGKQRVGRATPVAPAPPPVSSPETDHDALMAEREELLASLQRTNNEISELSTYMFNSGSAFMSYDEVRECAARLLGPSECSAYALVGVCSNTDATNVSIDERSHGGRLSTVVTITSDRPITLPQLTAAPLVPAR